MDIDGEDDLATPGQNLGSTTEYQPGQGTFLHPDTNSIHATLVGRIRTTEQPPLPPLISVIPSHPTPAMPQLDDIVTGLITKITPKQAHLSISLINNKPLPQSTSFAGLIRSVDVRSSNKDSVVVGDFFKAGDVVQARVIASGEREWLLSTAEFDMGVVVRKQSEG